MKKVLLMSFICLSLAGCPLDDNDCAKIMQCEDDVEMLCDKNDAGCGEDCHYFVYEHCYEVCK